MININKTVLKVITLICFLILLTFIKTDFRLDEIFYGDSVDDAEYYYHAVTIGVDYDLDYSNQMIGVTNRNLNFENNNIAPFHPIGSGLFSFPFVLISNLLLNNFNGESLISYNYFFYSLSSIFYLFLSIKIIFKILKLLELDFKKIEVVLFIFGTGVTYFAFERFSMSHIYEFFSTSLMILLSLLLFNKSKLNLNLNFFLIGFLGFVFFSIRWTNYFIFLLPLFMLLVTNNRVMLILKNKFYVIGSLLGLGLFLLHTKLLYGIYTLNQAPIVLRVESSFREDYEKFFNFSKLFDNIIYIFNSLFTILFTPEFGLFYFAPILFLLTPLFIYFILNKKFQLSAIYLIMFFIPLMSIVVISNTAFSYGFRYLFALIPLNIVLYYKYLKDSKFVKYYLYVASIVGLIGYVVFETNSLTSLSNDYVINSFGMETRYSNPNYLNNLHKVIFEPSTYLHIIFTSFLGVLIIKLIGLFTDPVEFISTLSELNEKITFLINEYILFSWSKLFLLIIFLYLCFRNLIKD